MRRLFSNTCGILRASLTSFPSPAAMPAVLVGLGEWTLAPARRWRSFVWVLIAALMIGCVVPLVQQPLDMTGASITIPGGGGWPFSLGYLFYWPLLVILTWTAIPGALASSEESHLPRRVVIACLASASVVAFMIFFHIAIFQLARRSLVSSGPFSRHWAASILALRHNSLDDQFLWTALERADWSADYGPSDYRRACIEVLAMHDPKKTARRIAEMLRYNPSRMLASFSASLLIREGRYETVPLLMRYALLDDWECAAALESIGVPDVAMVILRDASVSNRLGGSGAPASDFPITAKQRQRLSRLLGHDAGPNFKDWIKYYPASVDSLPSPLPAPIAAETSRVVQIMSQYHVAADHLAQAQFRLAASRFDSDTTLSGTYKDIALVEIYLPKAVSDMSVAPPDWNARDSDSLEREVADYEKRVNETISRNGLSPTAPTSSRSDLAAKPR